MPPEPSQAPANPAAESKLPEPSNASEEAADFLQTSFADVYKIDRFFEYILNDEKMFPKVLPVTVDTLGRMIPGEAALKLHGNSFQTVCVFGVVGWSEMNIPGYIEYSLFDANVDDDVYVNVVQTIYPNVDIPICYPVGAHISVSGFLCGVGEPKPSSTTLVAYEVRPITKMEYHEYLFQARVVQLRIASGKLPKIVIPKKDLYNVPRKDLLTYKFADFPDAKRLDAAISFALDKEAPKSALFKETDENKKLKYCRYAGLLQTTRGTTSTAKTNDISSEASTSAAKPAKSSLLNNAANLELIKKSIKYLVPFSFYDCHVPLTVKMLANNPTRDKFVWLGLPFKHIRTIGQIFLTSKLETNEIHYHLRDHENTHKFTVIVPWDKQEKPIAIGSLIEVLGKLRPADKTYPFDAINAKTVTVIDEDDKIVQAFFEQVKYVRDDIDERIQALIVAKSYSHYRLNHGKPTGKCPLIWYQRLSDKFQFGEYEGKAKGD